MSSPPLPGKQEILERKANVIRSRLLRTIDRLDRRRHRGEVAIEHAVDVGKRSIVPLALAAGIAVSLGLARAWVAHRRRVHEQNRMSVRLLAPLVRPILRRAAPKETWRTGPVAKTISAATVAIATALFRRYAWPLLDRRILTRPGDPTMTQP